MLRQTNLTVFNGIKIKCLTGHDKKWEGKNLENKKLISQIKKMAISFLPVCEMFLEKNVENPVNSPGLENIKKFQIIKDVMCIPSCLLFIV
jgi:hypothetical protein